MPRKSFWNSFGKKQRKKYKRRAYKPMSLGYSKSKGYSPTYIGKEIGFVYSYKDANKYRKNVLGGKGFIHKKKVGNRNIYYIYKTTKHGRRMIRRKGRTHMSYKW